MNKISTELLKLVDKVLENQEVKKYIQNKVNDIRPYFDSQILNKKFYNYSDKISYNQVFDKEIKLQDKNIHRGFSSSDTILNKITMHKKYELIIDNKKVVVNIYHEDMDNTILNNNINKIMTRLFNLYIIYNKRKYNYNNKKVDLFDFNFNLYLYSNPRSANKDMYGAKYLNDLHHTEHRCFNTSSGQTDIDGFSIDKKTVVVSRLEDFLALLTHEFLHVVKLIVLDGYKIKNLNISLSCLEMFVNAFSSILNAYLISYEMNMDLGLAKLNQRVLEALPSQDINQNLLYEITHAINQCIKLKKITNYSLEDILKSENIKWHQNAYIYEYIYGRILILLNFDYLMKKYPKINKNLFSEENGWDESNNKESYKMVNEFHNLELNKENLKIINLINNIVEKELDKLPENNNICGNMIMQYFALDPIVIDTDTYKVMLGGSLKEKINMKRYKIHYSRDSLL
jgi:hypothetical protein